MVIGGVILIVLIIYAWNFKKDGLFHHNLFLHRNFVISLVALAIEGMSYMAAGIYFPASLSVVQSGKMDGYRQSLCYMVGFCAFAVVTLATGHYVSKTKTVQVTGGPAFVAIMIFFILMATVTASTPEASFWGYICFFWTILGLAFVSFFTVAQFATGPELIAVTIGPAVSIRSFGGSVGLANFNALAANGYSKEVVLKVTAAVVALGLPSQRIAPLIAGLTASNMTLVNSIPDVTTGIIEAAGLAMKEARLIGYRDVFICGAAFSLVAAIVSSFLYNPKSEFSANIDAPLDVPSPPGEGDENLRLNRLPGHRSSMKKIENKVANKGERLFGQGLS